MQQQDRTIRLYFLGLLGLYCLIGFYGTLWVSDEFDRERSLFYAFAAIPGAIAFFIRVIARPHWLDDFPLSYWTAVILILTAFSWGNILWLNAVSSQENALVNVTLNEGVYAVTHQRGGFGWLYKPRW
ncbi:MAG: hypothetical protein NTX25_16930 [Proteobacteria bacterium]|nr:hypothetical protein [Pseudomonadota bacterium]